MFRSGLLDWSRPALAAAGAGAFALLTEEDDHAESGADPLTTATARWSLAHGLAMLLIDGRLGPIAEKAGGPDLEALVEGVLATGLREPRRRPRGVRVPRLASVGDTFLPGEEST